MKNIIRWLCKVSGVRREIINESRAEIANNLPIHYLKLHPKAYNVLFMLRDDLINNEYDNIGVMGDKYRHYLIIFGDNLVVDVENQITTKSKKNNPEKPFN